MSMTPRERALAVLRGERPDRIPWFGDLAYWITYMQRTGQMPDPLPDEALLKLHRELGVGFYLQGFYPFRTGWEAVPRTIKRDRAPDGAGSAGVIRSCTIHTPYGDITEHTQFLESSFSTGYIEHYIKTPDDLAPLRWVYEHLSYAPDYALAESRRTLIGDQGLLLVYTNKSPAMEMIAALSGIENFSYIMADAPDELAETLACMERTLVPSLEMTLASPSDCIMIPENITSESVGKRIYDDYIRALHVDWTSRIRVAGKYSFVHLDGTMRGLIAEISSSGFDVIEALTPAPVGDIEYGGIRAAMRGAEMRGGSNVIWGGIPGAYFTDDYTDSQFDSFVRGVIEVAKADGRCVLGVADQVPPYSRAARIARVAELVEKYG